MGTGDEFEGDAFFDTCDEFNCCGFDSDCSTSGSTDDFAGDFWFRDLESVSKRRERFMRLMDLNLDDDEEQQELEDGDDDSCGGGTKIHGVLHRTRKNYIEPEPVLSNPELENVLLERQSSFSFQTGLVESEEDGLSKRTSEEELERNLSSSTSLTQSTPGREFDGDGNMLDRRKIMKKGWLRKLNVISRVVDKKGDESMSKKSKPKPSIAGVYPVNVHVNKKHSKELSSLYVVQEFGAHKGSILTIKFSHDGRYLASAGDDGVVRVWKVIEIERPSKLEIQGTDPSSFIFSTNHLSELVPFTGDKEKTRNKACVILPPKLFRILENPVHEFHGHGGEVLALSWSKRGYLLSSSVDKTVRLWQIGHDECLKVFHHTDYVTSVEFNPVNDNFFISGSIDGKVRIWEVPRAQVIDWTDLREIITAVCYAPDGKGCIVGSINGNCSFYDIIDKRLQLSAQISLTGKKKLPAKRGITGFQFCPIDARKVIVSCADSHVRVLCGINIVGKFKGNRSSGNQMPATFTKDGKHIVSSAEDSNVYVWNHISSDKLISKPKTNLSCESFSSQDVSVAIPWCGMKSIAAALPSPRLLLGGGGGGPQHDLRRATIDSPKPSSSPLGRLPFLETLRKPPPTWPAETLPPDSTQVCVSPSMRRSEYRFLKSAYQSTFVAPHVWGLVIVTACWDGKIRTFLNYGLPIRV